MDMSLIPWKGKNRENGGTQALAPLSEFRSEMDRLFDSFFRDPSGAMSELSGNLSAWSPSLDVAETDDEVTVRAENPGADPKDIDISVEGSRLVISGEKKE